MPATGSEPCVPRLLVAHRDASIRSLLHDVLVDAGYDVLLAKSAREALEAAAARPPDVLLVGGTLDDLDARELCTRYRARGGAARIVLLTAHADPRALATACGADDLVAMPFDLDDVVRAVERQVVRPT